MRPLIIRADATSRIGHGHVMRCTALADRWIEIGGRVTFVGRIEGSGLQDRLRASACDVRPAAGNATGDAADLELLTGMARESGAAVVIDHYQLGSAYQRAMFEAGHPLLVIDDYAHQADYFATFLLNQNAGADRYEYRTPRETRRLIGPGFALLRAVFRATPQPARETAAIARRVLVTMGGSDQGDAIEAALALLHDSGVSDLQVTVLSTGAESQYERATAAVEGMPWHVRVERSVTDVTPYMAAADFAISAAGSTVWELAYFGVPTLLFVLFENQVGAARALEAQGVASSIGDPRKGDPRAMAALLGDLLRSAPARAAMTVRAQQLVDGRGAERVVAAIAEV